jgi:purine-binding chemotaxis protein CheW
VRNTAQAIPQLQIVIFRIGAEEFGLDVFTVHEILRYQAVTPVPRAPEFVEGVIDVRGALVPVIDLRRRFEVEVPDVDSDTRIVLVQFGGERLGLIVNAVSEVLRIPETAVADPPQYFHGLAAEYIRGIARLPERLVILLDVERVLSSQERIALENATFEPADESTTVSAPNEDG